MWFAVHSPSRTHTIPGIFTSVAAKILTTHTWKHTRGPVVATTSPQYPKCSRGLQDLSPKTHVMRGSGGMRVVVQLVVSCLKPFMAARHGRDLHVTSAPDLCCALLCAGGMRVVVQNPFPDLERVCISGHHGRSRFVAYCTSEPAHTRTRSTRSLRTVLPLTPPSPIRISKGCLLTPPAIRTRRRIARASSQASCTERCTRQPSPTTQPTPS